VDLGAEMTPGSVVRCATNIVNTKVLLRCPFFKYLENWMTSSRPSLVLICVCFKFDDFLGIPWREPG
jgi:hypothetical protein